MSRAYAITDNDCPPDREDGGKWYVLRLAMGIFAKSRCDHGLPEKVKAQNCTLPSFAMIATDRAAARNEMLARFDAMWDAWEEEEKENGQKIRNG